MDTKVEKNEFELDSLESEFNKLYLSHEIHARKPEAAAFEIILKEKLDQDVYF